MNSRIAFAASAALIAAIATPAAAVTTISQTVGIPGALAPAGSPVQFQGFNSALGTLTAVTLGFSANSSTSVQITNNTNRVRSWTITPSSTVGLAGNGFNLSDMEGGSVVTIDVGRRFSASNPRVETLIFPALYSASATQTSNLGGFVGAGQIAFNFSRLAAFTVAGSGGPFIVTAPMEGEATLTYSFDTPIVPEPATWALLIAGFGLVGIAARRRPVASVTD